MQKKIETQELSMKEREGEIKQKWVLHVWILTAIGLYSLYTDII